MNGTGASSLFSFFKELLFIVDFSFPFYVAQNMNLSSLIKEFLKDALYMMDQVLAEDEDSYYGGKLDSFFLLFFFNPG